jgi:L-rhamnose isomerase
LNRLHVDLIDRTPVGVDFPPAPSFTASAQALEAWLDATRDSSATVGPALVAAIEDAAHMVTEERRTSRHELLEDVAFSARFDPNGPQRSRSAQLGRWRGLPRLASGGITAERR